MLPLLLSNEYHLRVLTMMLLYSIVAFSVTWWWGIAARWIWGVRPLWDWGIIGPL